MGQDLGRMTRTERIQWQIFILLLVGIAASFYYFSKPSRSGPIAANPRKPSAKAGTAAVVDNLPQVSMLHGKVPEFEEVHRNVFEFAGESSNTAEEETISQPVLPSPQSMPLIAVGPDVTYLGFYRENSGSNRKLAAISNGGQIYVGGQGEILAGKYRVIQVEDEFIEVEYLPEKRVIRLELGRHNAPPLE
jgi:hypothetical protein